MEQILLSISDLNCEGCADAIRDQLKRVDGIDGVEIDLKTRRVTVRYDRARLQPDAVVEQVGQAGFTARVSGEPPGPPKPAAEGWYLLLVSSVVLLALAGYLGYEFYPRFDLPAVEGAALLFLAAGAGVASFFSPCAFPLLVTFLGRGLKATPGAHPIGKGIAFGTALSVGAALFLALTGLIIALGGGALFAQVTFTSVAGRIIRTVTGLFLIILGLIQLSVIPNPLHVVESLARPLMRAQAQYRRRIPVIGFGILGFGYLLAGFG